MHLIASQGQICKQSWEYYTHTHTHTHSTHTLFVTGFPCLAVMVLTLHTKHIDQPNWAHSLVRCVPLRLRVPKQVNSCHLWNWLESRLPVFCVLGTGEGLEEEGVYRN